MTKANPSAAPSAARHRLRWVLLTLCITEITSWGVLYFDFTLLSEQISADTGWSAPAVTAAFSAGLVTSAVVGIPVGRWLDQVGPRWIMTAGALYPAGSQRHTIHAGLGDMRKARNRVAHHEPVRVPDVDNLIADCAATPATFLPISGAASDRPAQSTRFCTHVLDMTPIKSSRRHRRHRRWCITKVRADAPSQ